MIMDVNKIFASMFFLILVFLIVTRAGEVNLLVQSIGGFITKQTQALQGVSTGFGTGSLIPSSDFKGG
jgi:hypothetical protein